jgi:hypothetical protein
MSGGVVLTADAEIAEVDDRYAKAQGNVEPLAPCSVCTVDILASVCLHEFVGHNLDILYRMRISFTIILMKFIGDNLRIVHGEHVLIATLPACVSFFALTFAEQKGLPVKVYTIIKSTI